MIAFAELEAALNRFPRATITQAPTPIETLTNLSHDLGISLAVKRDDCTGFALGGNKVRQLEFYIGAALAEGADTLLITGAVQSNFVRTAAAAAARFNLRCHVQLEERVDDTSETYRQNGNVLLDKLLGATLHTFAEGENESGADAAMEAIATDLRHKGANPYIIHLSAAQPPLGALGYVIAAIELANQTKNLEPFDEIIISSGSALTHSGLLFGLRALGLNTRVRGVCVRRNAELQATRVAHRTQDIATLLNLPLELPASDICVYDGSLAPGYGQLNDATIDAIHQAAQREGLFLDPVYTGKTLAGLIQLAQQGHYSGKRILFWHTGGQPALFGYADQLSPQTLQSRDGSETY